MVSRLKGSKFDVSYDNNLTCVLHDLFHFMITMLKSLCEVGFYIQVDI